MWFCYFLFSVASKDRLSGMYFKSTIEYINRFFYFRATSLTSTRSSWWASKIHFRPFWLYPWGLPTNFPPLLFWAMSDLYFSNCNYGINSCFLFLQLINGSFHFTLPLDQPVSGSNLGPGTLHRAIWGVADCSVFYSRVNIFFKLQK